MPIYEYRCASCQKDTEFMMKFSDPTPEACPKCGTKGQMSKLLSQTGFILQGGGWYKEGYTSKSNQKPDSGKADAKPASSDSGAASSTPAPASSSGGSKE